MCHIRCAERSCCLYCGELIPSMFFITADHAVLCVNAPTRNMCELLENPCENGHCINMGYNEYRCECNTGFLVSDNQKSCYGKNVWMK